MNSDKSVDETVTSGGGGLLMAIVEAVSVNGPAGGVSEPDTFPARRLAYFNLSSPGLCTHWNPLLRLAQHRKSASKISCRGLTIDRKNHRQSSRRNVYVLSKLCKDFNTNRKKGSIYFDDTLSILFYSCCELFAALFDQVLTSLLMVGPQWIL